MMSFIFYFIHLTEGKQKNREHSFCKKKKRARHVKEVRLERLHGVRFLLFKPRLIRQTYAERRRLAPENMGSNTHTHQRTQLTILTNIIEREFVATAIRCFKSPYAIGSLPSLLGHAIPYRWRSLPRVRRHRASNFQGSSKRVLPWQVTMDQ